MGLFECYTSARESSLRIIIASQLLLCQCHYLVYFALKLRDEVGFIHPSQFGTLNEEASHLVLSSDNTLSSNISDADASKHVNASFWNKDHKLGISTEVLFPLYQRAKSAFMAAIKQYKALISNSSDNSWIEDSPCNSLSSHDSIEDEVMKHSRALLLLSCDFGTVWHSRFSLFLCLDVNCL